jgi:hypothetical protein
MQDVMRTTLTLDDDVLAAAKELAQAQNKTVGEVISALTRQAIIGPATTRKYRNGIRLLPIQPGGGIATMELVNKLRDELP